MPIGQDSPQVHSPAKELHILFHSQSASEFCKRAEFGAKFAAFIADFLTTNPRQNFRG